MMPDLRAMLNSHWWDELQRHTAEIGWGNQLVQRLRKELNKRRGGIRKKPHPGPKKDDGRPTVRANCKVAAGYETEGRFQDCRILLKPPSPDVVWKDCIVERFNAWFRDLVRDQSMESIAERSVGYVVAEVAGKIKARPVGCCAHFRPCLCHVFQKAHGGPTRAELREMLGMQDKPEPGDISLDGMFTQLRALVARVEELERKGADG